AAVRLLPDERDHSRPKRARELLEPLDAAGEIAGSEVAGAWRGAVGRVGDADSEREQVELLGGVEEPRRQPDGVEQAPEVIAGVREVRVRRIREAARVD